MKICVDENIPLNTIGELRDLGHEVLDIRGTINQGISDDVLWPNAQKIHERVMQAMKQFPEDEWAGLVVVMRDVVQSSWRAI